MLVGSPQGVVQPHQLVHDGADVRLEQGDQPHHSPVLLLHVEAVELCLAEHRVQGQVGDVQVHVPLPCVHGAWSTQSIKIVQTVEHTAVMDLQIHQAGSKLNQGDCVGSGTKVGGQKVILGIGIFCEGLS